MMLRAFSILFLLLLCSTLAHAQQQITIKEHKLKNGMKILVNEDHSIPSVALYIFYKIGSRNERPGTTGLSHFFEHMMFNGSKKYRPGMFDRVMEDAGGNNNAYTNQNVTVYTDFFPSSALETIFDLEADRIANLTLDPKVVESERGVVASERRVSVEDNPEGQLDELLMSTAFIAHPYQWPVIGWMSDIENWTMEDLERHYRMGYSPSNAVMVVSGDVRFEEVVRLAEKYIEPIAASAPPPEVKTVEPEQKGERRVVLERPAQLPLLNIAYHIPEAKHPDTAVLTLLHKILCSGESSRLYRRLIDRDQSALSIFCNIMDISFDPTLFYITARINSGRNPEDVEKAIYEELTRIASEGVSEQELQKAKNSLQVEFYGNLKTISSKANSIGLYEVFYGDYKRLFTAVSDYEKVSINDIKRIVSKYLRKQNRTVATLIPTPEEAK